MRNQALSVVLSKPGAPRWWCTWIFAAGLSVLLLAGGIANGQQVPPADWWTAIDNDDVSVVEGFLLRNVDPDAFNKKGNPALIQAARDQSWKVFDALRAAPGVKLDEPNAYGETALMYLCIQGQTKRALDLIKAGAQVNRLGWTPLHYAASKGQIETAKLLISHGAIVNAPGPDGTTALMMAALSGNRAMVDLLLAHGADPTMFTLAHETAADWARKRNNLNIAQQLDDAAAQREAERQLGADTQPAASAPSAPAAAQPSTHTAPAAPSKDAASASPSEDKSSFSRYFDLGRFDKPVK